MILRPFLYDETACASYLFGCLTHSQLAVVDPHVELVESYLDAAERAGSPIAAVFETHVQADHVSGLPALVEATGATAYLPADAGVEFEHEPLSDGDVVELGNTVVRAIATPGHAPAHLAFVVADRRRGTEEPWLVFSGDSLLVGDVGRPDLHSAGDPSRWRGSSSARWCACSSCPITWSFTRATTAVRSADAHSGNPFSSIGFERRHNQALAHADEDSFRALLQDAPPPPADQAAIVAANRSGLSPARR